MSSTTWDTLLTLAAPLLVAVMPLLIALAAYFYQRLLQSLPMNTRLIVSAMAHTVVNAVEQTLPDATGPQKKSQALTSMEKILRNHGIKAPAALIDAALEAAVFELHSLYPHSSDAATLLRVPAVATAPTSSLKSN